jgi:hypothetical protein
VNAVTEPAPGEIVFSGTFDEVQEHFHQKLWTDGLPVVPPTRERVDAFLRFTDRKPEEVLRAIPQEGREASIPEHRRHRCHGRLPARIHAGPHRDSSKRCAIRSIRVEDSGSTPGWEPVVIVSGPIVKQLDFNYGQA